MLCEFRARLLEGNAESLLLDTLLQGCREKKLLKAGGKQRTDSTHVLAAVRAINRYELVLETMRAALDALATADPDWLRAHLQPDWGKRYVRRADAERLPAKTEERRELAQRVGADGRLLLQAVATDASLRPLPAVQVLRRVWVQNYQQTDQGWEWREADNIAPAACFLSSP